jgi:signal transduction histidine kinase
VNATFILAFVGAHFGGAVTVFAAWREHRSLPKWLLVNSLAVVTVADDGCGMDGEFISRSLFRPFQTTKKNGFGIGMFQSRMIVEAHGGRIDVESQLGKGTTFRVFLPLKKA